VVSWLGSETQDGNLTEGKRRGGETLLLVMPERGREEEGRLSSPR